MTSSVIVGLALHYIQRWLDKMVYGQNGVDKMVWAKWYGQNGSNVLYGFKFNWIHIYL